MFTFLMCRGGAGLVDANGSVAGVEAGSRAVLLLYELPHWVTVM